MKFNPVIAGLALVVILFGAAACAEKEDAAKKYSLPADAIKVINGNIDPFCYRGYQFLSHSRGGVEQVMTDENKPMTCRN